MHNHSNAIIAQYVDTQSDLRLKAKSCLGFDKVKITDSKIGITCL